MLSHEKKVNKGCPCRLWRTGVQMIDLIKAFRDLQGKNVYVGQDGAHEG